MKVEHNNVVIWKGGKPITVNVDQVRIYHPKERDECVVETDGLDGEGSRAEQVETEGSKGLAKEKRTRENQCRGKRMMSEGSTKSCNNKESLHQRKRRPPVRRNKRKRSAPSSLVENSEVKRRPHESCKKIPLCGIFDSGNESNIITTKAADLLGLQKENINTPISGLNDCSLFVNNKVATEISNQEGDEKWLNDLLVLPKITDCLPSRITKSFKLKYPW
ncbi:hypothetical protein NPIL_374831 [Nephila pilipes]|uniref:Uncharacterized protein n=1 Tax=Nephila pilipes TaxID=299642 RepID=A0A8X6N413_NEPPI|nr:hypothetical protein NPIL_374831 [Nephila pilipes]